MKKLIFLHHLLRCHLQLLKRITNLKKKRYLTITLLIKATLVDFAQIMHILGYPKLDTNKYQPIKHFISINVTCIDFPASTILFVLV